MRENADDRQANKWKNKETIEEKKARRKNESNLYALFVLFFLVDILS
jgi:hypothetical protein